MMGKLDKVVIICPPFNHHLIIKGVAGVKVVLPQVVLLVCRWHGKGFKNDTQGFGVGAKNLSPVHHINPSDD